MKEPAIHGSPVQNSDRAAVGVRQNSLAAKLGGDALEPRSDFVESFIPGDVLKDSSTVARSQASSHRAFGCDPAHGIQHAVRRVHAVKILGDFSAQKSASHGMRRITLYPRSTAVVDGDQDATGVGTIVGTSGVDGAF